MEELLMNMVMEKLAGQNPEELEEKSVVELYGEAKMELDEGNVEDCVDKLESVALMKKKTKDIGQMEAHFRVERQFFVDYIKDLQERTETLEGIIGYDKLIQKAGEMGVCTQKLTGKRFIKQKWFDCKTCDIQGDNGLCEVCVKLCHKDCKIVEKEESPAEMYCDCNDYACEIMKSKTEEEEEGEEMEKK